MSWIPDRSKRVDLAHSSHHARSGQQGATRPPLSAELKHRIAHVLHQHGLLDAPLHGRAPLMRQHFMGTAAHGSKPVDRYEVETRLSRAGGSRTVISVIDISPEGDVHLVK